MSGRPDLAVYLVTGGVPAGRSLDAVVAAAVESGVGVVQLRDKAATTSTLARTAERLLHLLAPSGVPLVIDDDVAAARLSGAAGVHLGVDDADPRDARDRLGDDALVGWSVESTAQLEDAGDVLAACSYVAASPVWSTRTKTDTAPALGLDGVAAVAARLSGRLPLIAIGGIDATRAEQVVAAGADGVAVVSMVCSADDPAAAVRLLRTAVARGLARRDARAGAADGPDGRPGNGRSGNGRSGRRLVRQPAPARGVVA